MQEMIVRNLAQEVKLNAILECKRYPCNVIIALKKAGWPTN